MASFTDELKGLAELLEQGLLTQEQFEQQREHLLAEARRPSSAPEIPNEVGAYRILGHVGDGGMGSVYRARHRTEAIAKRQGGDVALKKMHPQFARNSKFQARFEREASLGLELDHPGIVKVHDLVVDAGILALSMELVEGQPLSDVIGSVTGPLPWERARPMLEQLLDAVGHAHEHGVVHRDLKPENVMVTEEGQLKVLDFGIAKEAGSGTTKTGSGMGTVDYMAPEQYVDAKNVDRRADIYALGMTLYEMLAGQLPWDIETPEFTVLDRKMRGDIPPPTEFYPDIPPEVVALVAGATAVNIDERFDSIESFRQAVADADAAADEREEGEQTEARERASEAGKPQRAAGTKFSNPISTPPPPAPPAKGSSSSGKWILLGLLLLMGLGGAGMVLVIGVGVIAGMNSSPSYTYTPAPVTSHLHGAFAIAKSRDSKQALRCSAVGKSENEATEWDAQQVALRDCERRIDKRSYQCAVWVQSTPSSPCVAWAQSRRTGDCAPSSGPNLRAAKDNAIDACRSWAGMSDCTVKSSSCSY